MCELSDSIQDYASKTERTNHHRKGNVTRMRRAGISHNHTPDETRKDCEACFVASVTSLEAAIIKIIDYDKKRLVSRPFWERALFMASVQLQEMDNAK